VKENRYSIRYSFRSLASSALFVLFCPGIIINLAEATPSPAAVPNDSVIVQSMFGGEIFGFGIDQTGTDGVLAEAQDLPSGKVLAAIETFDQTTGAIIKVVQQTQSHDDFLTLGVVGRSVGLVEHEHVVHLFDIKRTYLVLDPLRRNRITGKWTPPVDTGHLVSSVCRNQGTDNVAVFAEDFTGNFQPFVFSSNVAANTFGPVVTITDDNFTSGLPALAYDDATNQAVLGAPQLGNPFVPGWIATVDLAVGTFTKFSSVGEGDVNGLAVDPVTGTACTTTEIDFSVEFYDLATHAGSTQILPNAPNQFYSGADVEFDALNKLFLVAQPNSSTAFSGSSIHVYDVGGNFIESINGLDFTNVFNVFIALRPSKRIGFVIGGPGLTQIQSFSY